MADESQQQNPTEAPVTPATPEQQQQTVSGQYFAQPQAAPVQYVVAAKSLKGKGGWLAFFMVLSALAALGYAAQFINSFSGSHIVDTIFSPLLFAFALAAVILIALEKALAKWIYIGFWAASLIYDFITSAVAGDEVSTLATRALLQIVVLVFVILYFVTSKRVKETLVN